MLNTCLGAAPPGSHSDVAPTWLVHAATAHSKMEHQRSDRVYWSEKNRKKGKGGGKGKKGKDGAPKGGDAQ